MSETLQPSTTEHNADPLIGQVLAGRFHVLAAVGAGGAARVYRAVQLPINRQVALKVIKIDPDDVDRDQFETRFLREAAQAGRLSHPNIVTVFDFGRTEDGYCFLAMEMLDGVSMRRMLTGEPLAPERAVRLALGIARGLRHAHGKGMVHRDVKPSNVFIVQDDEGKEVPRLLDFGLVKADDTTITRSGAFMGTPHYIAPEQARGLPQVDGRADLYSLGCMMYRMLTGVLPYQADNPMAIALQHVRSPYPPMSERRPDVKVDHSLERIVRRLMEKEPAHRHASAAELVRELEGWLNEHTAAGAGRTVDEGPTTTIAPAIGPEAPKRRAGLAVVLAGALLAMGVGAAVVLGKDRARETDGAATPTMQEAPVVEPTVAEPTVAEPVVEPAVEPVVAEAVAEPTNEPVVAKPVVHKAPHVEPTVAQPKTIEPTVGQPKAVEPTVGRPQAPASTGGGQIIVDGVRLDAAHADRALTFVNTATEADLQRAGIYGRGVTIILGGRPFPSFAEFGETPYIGEKTIQSIADATQ